MGSFADVAVSVRDTLLPRHTNNLVVDIHDHVLCDDDSREFCLFEPEARVSDSPNDVNSEWCLEDARCSTNESKLGIDIHEAGNSIQELLLRRVIASCRLFEWSK